jgi:hypothetical protein
VEGQRAPVQRCALARRRLANKADEWIARHLEWAKEKKDWVSKKELS